MAEVADVRRVNGIDLYSGARRLFNRFLKVAVIGAGLQPVNARSDHEYLMTVLTRGPAFDYVREREIRACTSADQAHGNPERLGGQSMVGRGVLADVNAAITHVGHANHCSRGLCLHKLTQIIKLAADTRIGSVVHQYEELEPCLVALERCPFSDRRAVLAVESANIFFIDG